MPDRTGVTAAACLTAGLRPPATVETIRQGLAQVASGAAIATCWGGGRPTGGLARVATVSLAPPRLLLCLDKSAAGHDDLLAAEAVGVSLLSADQRGLAESFRATDDGRRFDPARWRLEPARPPELRDALAAFAGLVRCRIDAGPATIFILDVGAAASGAGAPLLQVGGALQPFANETAPNLPPSLAH